LAADGEQSRREREESGQRREEREGGREREKECTVFS